MKAPAKLHVYNANEPDGECVIVGNRNGLLKLSEQLFVTARLTSTAHYDCQQ